MAMGEVDVEFRFGCLDCLHEWKGDVAMGFRCPRCGSRNTVRISDDNGKGERMLTKGQWVRYKQVVGRG